MYNRGMVLNPRQERFCIEYHLSGNATQAAIKAGYSPRTARAIGPEQLKKPAIRKRMAELREERRRQTQERLDRDDVVKKLLDIIGADITDFADPDWMVSLPRDVTSAVHERTEFKDGSERVKLESKLKAIEILNRMMGWDRPELDDEPTGPKIVEIE